MTKFICKNTELNLCDSCDFCIAYCNQDVKFGNGIGNDNVIECNGYQPIGELPKDIEEIND